MQDRPNYVKHEIQLEHYVVSTGIAEMVRGSQIAPMLDGVWACEFIENPLQPGFLKQKELEITAEAEIAQIGMVIDNTTKTRALFEINKGTNKNPAIDVNSSIKPEDRRIPFQNMIYIADGPSDIPSFSVVKGGGGRTYGVYNPDNPAEFEQNDRLLQAGRIHGYGPADYTETSSTSRWLRMHIQAICDRIVSDRELAVSQKAAKPPRHLNLSPEEEAARRAAKTPSPSRGRFSSAVVTGPGVAVKVQGEIRGTPGIVLGRRRGPTRQDGAQAAIPGQRDVVGRGRDAMGLEPPFQPFVVADRRRRPIRGSRAEAKGSALFCRQVAAQNW